MHFPQPNWIYFHATSTVSLLLTNRCVTSVKWGIATRENLSCSEIDKVLGSEIKFQGIDTLNTLNTLSDLQMHKIMKDKEQAHTQYGHMSSGRFKHW